MLDSITQQPVNEDAGNWQIEPTRLSIVRKLQVVPDLLIQRKVDALYPDSVLSGWELRVISGMYQKSDNFVADLDTKHHKDSVTICHDHWHRLAIIEDGRVAVPSLDHN